MLLSTHIDHSLKKTFPCFPDSQPFHHTGGIKNPYKSSARDTTTHPSSVPHPIFH